MRFRRRGSARAIVALTRAHTSTSPLEEHENIATTIVRSLASWLAYRAPLILVLASMPHFYSSSTGCCTFTNSFYWNNRPSHIPNPIAALHIYEPIANWLGVPPVIVLFTFAILGVMALAGCLISCAVCLGPGTPKRHAD